MPDTLKILIIEDDKNYQKFYKQLLRPHFNVEIVSTKKSHNTLTQKAFASVVANCYLRGSNRKKVDGFSLLRYARSRGCFAPFVFVAEARDKYIDCQGTIYGAFDLIQKKQRHFHSNLIRSLKVSTEFYAYQKNTRKIDQKIRNRLRQIKHITPIRWDYIDQALYQRFFEKDSKLNSYCYANNWMYICQAARRNGHKFFDGKVLITIEAYKKEQDYQFEIIRPLGKNAARKSFELAQRLKDLSPYPVILKRLEPDQENSLLKRGCREYTLSETNKLEELFDDIYPQVVIDLESFLHNLKLHQMYWFRRGLRKITGKNYTIKDLEPHLYRDVREVILRWKRSLITRYKNRQEFTDIPEYDSYYLDPYLPFVQYLGRTSTRRDVIASIFYVDDKAVGFSIMARVSNTCMAMYANVADTEYTGLSYFMLYQNFLRALWAGYSYVNLGGTELESLYEFYLKLTGGKYSNQQSLSLNWGKMSLYDINNEFSRFKKNIMKRHNKSLLERLKTIFKKEDEKLKGDLINLNIDTLFMNIASRRKELKILLNSRPKNQILERKYLFYGAKHGENQSSYSRI